MKGMIFTEFLEMVEERFSYAMVDKIIAQSTLQSGGAYTAVGTYHHSEIVQLVTHLSNETEIAIPTLLRLFGERLFQSFSMKYAHFLEHAPSAFDFLERLESYVHAEVQKLYPEAELPHFECIRTSDQAMTMIYRSHRSLGDVAYGLMIGCFRYFEEDINIQREELSEGRGTAERFILTRHSAPTTPEHTSSLVTSPAQHLTASDLTASTAAKTAPAESATLVTR